MNPRFSSSESQRPAHFHEIWTHTFKLHPRFKAPLLNNPSIYTCRNITVWIGPDFLIPPLLPGKMVRQLVPIHIISRHTDTKGRH